MRTTSFTPFVTKKLDLISASGPRLFRKRTAVALLPLLIGCVLPVSAETVSVQAVRNVVADNSNTSLKIEPIQIGDKLKLSFFEILDDEESKWRGPNGRSITAPREFHERGELAGEYAVQEDGSINVPVLGNFNAAGQDKSALSNQLTAALEALVGRKGYVSIVSWERQPIYVIGPVKNPGAYKYQVGLTALHAIALAGGMQRVDGEAWQNIESRREIVGLGKALDKVKRLIARTVVLKADRGDGPSSISALVSLVGTQDGKLLIDQEASRQRLSQINEAVTEAALKTAINNYRAELSARTGRIAPFDDNIKLRTERVRGLEQLVDKNLSTRAALIEAQSELTDVQDRRQQALIDVDAIKQKLAQSEQDLAKHNLETRLKIEQAVDTAEHESADAVADTEGSLNILRTFATVENPSGSEGTTSFEVVRNESNGVDIIHVSETTLLRPGDLLRIRARGANSDEK